VNFRGHTIGGVISATAVAGISIVVQYTPINSSTIQQFIKAPLSLEGAIPTLIALFLITWFMALFPDLDTASIPQRWFFRAVFVILALLYFYRQMEWFAILSFAAISPVLHKHRGWTHWKITPWLIALYLAIVFEYMRVKNGIFASFSWDNILEMFQQYWIFVIACIVGHYTHLLLDSKQVKYLPFISNARDHH
jgi:hypothetical protein